VHFEAPKAGSSITVSRGPFLARCKVGFEGVLAKEVGEMVSKP
jgi:hypothetical protein